LRANDVPDARLRLTVTGGLHDGVIRLRRTGSPNLILTADPLVPPPTAAYREGVAIVVSRWIVPTDSPLARIKATNRLLHLMAKEDALERGAWDAVFVDESGHMLEGTNTNVFFVVDGTVRTASLEEPLLAGVTRDAVLEVAREGGHPVREGHVTRDDVARASEAFLTSTTIELLPLREVDGRKLPAPERPVWRDLARRFRRTVERETGVARGEIPGAE
jgi:branched-chain amino acid aminotransferase